MNMTFKEFRAEFESKYPITIREVRRPGIMGMITRQHLGFDTPHTDGMIILLNRLNVSYTYEPEYVQAHQASVAYYLGKGRWLRWEFSWPRK